MTELVTLLSTGKGTWSTVARVIKGENWSKKVIVTNSFGADKFEKTPTIEFVVVDLNQSVVSLATTLKTQLQDKLIGPEVALNMESGTGAEHMALLSALLQLGLGIRLVTFDNEVKTL